MLVPAILFKSEIENGYKKLFYTSDMLFESGSLNQSIPDIAENMNEGWFQYAIIGGEKVIGYLGYYVNYYTSNVYNFGLISFDRGNPLIGKDLFEKMEELVSRFHRIEWRMIGGNPVERSYDKFCEIHNGTKHVLKDALKDAEGNYRDSIIYEIVTMN